MLPRKTEPTGLLKIAGHIALVVAACAPGRGPEATPIATPTAESRPATAAPQTPKGRLLGRVVTPELSSCPGAVPAPDGEERGLAGVIVRGIAGRPAITGTASSLGLSVDPCADVTRTVGRMAGSELTLDLPGDQDRVYRVDDLSSGAPVRLETLATPKGLRQVHWSVPSSGILRLAQEDRLDEAAWVVVLGRPALTVTDAAGRFELGELPIRTTALTLWHPTWGERRAEVTPTISGEPPWVYLWDPP